jgi:hypothetical protein
MLQGMMSTVDDFAGIALMSRVTSSNAWIIEIKSIFKGEAAPVDTISKASSQTVMQDSGNPAMANRLLSPSLLACDSHQVTD